MKTAQQLQLGTYDRVDAYGAPNLHPVIAGHRCSVVRMSPTWITVIDDKGALNDFQGCAWAEIKKTMEERFGEVGT